MDSSSVTFVTVNYNTPGLLIDLLRSIRRHYPEVAVLVVDGSDGRVHAALARLACRSYGSKCDSVGRNIHHGPGLDHGLRTVETEFCVLVDTDVVITRRGFIEAAMESLRANDFGIGGIEWVDEHGINVEEGTGTPYLHPRLALVRRAAYLDGPPAIRHGAPFLPVMEAITRSKWTLARLPDIDQFFSEKRRGTVARTGGYHLHGDGMGSLGARSKRTARRIVEPLLRRFSSSQRRS